MGVTAVTVFHGQNFTYYNASGHGRRVYNRDIRGRNLRRKFHCRTRRQSLWYVGRNVVVPRHISEESRVWYKSIEKWGESLFNEGYAGTPGISMILSGGTLRDNGDIDPENRGMLLRPWTSSIRGRYPYTINWLVRNDELQMFE